MANSSIAVTPGTGASIDCEALSGGDLRQVVVIGDPTTTAGVAGVTATGGLKVDPGLTTVLDVTLSLDTAIYADGDVLADTQAISNAVRVSGGAAVLQSVLVLDEDDQGVAMDLLFLDAANSVGTENAAPSITDANARAILGRVRIDASDYVDLGGCRVALRSGLGIVLKANASTSLHVAAITRGGTPTYTASGVRLKLGLLQD